MSRLVVKIGGRVAADSVPAILELADDNEVCVVHGAGPQISLEMERAGIVPEFVGGRRVTTPEVLEIVKASLQSVNAAICLAIGDRAVPFLASDVGFEAVCWGPQLGSVGEAFPQDLPPVERVLTAGKIAVLAPLARDTDRPGALLNVNADDAAAAIAIGMGAERLIFLTDVEGFMLDGEVVEWLNVATAEQLSRGGSLDPTILPKLDAAIKAARFGVPAFIGRTEVEAEPRPPAMPLRRLGTA